LLPSFDVSVIGELNLDLILYGLPNGLKLECELLATNLCITLGSSSAIFAHNLASLGSKVAISSSVGGDPLGQICIDRLKEMGVDVSRVRRMHDKITGLTVILPQGQQRYILTYPGTMAEMKESDLDMPYLLEAKHLHVASYFLQKSLRPSFPDIFRRAKEAGLTTSLDTNDDPENRWSPDLQHLLKYVDILLPNEQEACRIAACPDVKRALDALANKVPIVVVKRGPKGAVLRSKDANFLAMPPAAEVVDSVGAGDSFDAGFIHRFVRGTTLKECLRFATSTAALSVTRAGGTEAFRESAHRDAFLRKHSSPIVRQLEPEDSL
jgi:sugar/nucleoside kinase (ribokinase family)